MCGIAGIFAFDGKAPEPRVLEAMAGAIKHRGPDDHGVFCDGSVGLASTRLSILDLSPSGHMPMIDEQTGLVIVHNGEIYNFKEIRRELGEQNFRTGTDTEVILKAYAAWGEKCLERLNGIFAFAIWDPRENRLFCVRDRLGVKPFLFVRQADRLVFASEAKALFLAGIVPAPDMQTIADYLVHGAYEHSEKTFFKSIEQLAPGHFMTLDRRGVNVRRYWDIADTDRWADDPDLSNQAAYRETQEKFLALVEDALRLQLRSDVPIAVHTSGGLDSTLMLSAINRLTGGQGNLKAFSYYYGEEQYDERPQVEELIAAAGWQAEYYRLNPEEVPDLAAEAMAFQEQPFPGIITLAKHKLIKASHAFGAKVILEGQGGDEIGAGYQYVMGSHLMDLIESGRADLATEEIRAFGRKNGLDGEATLKKCLNGMTAYHRTGWSADGTRFVRPDCLSESFLESAGELNFARPFKSHLMNMTYRDLFHTKLPRILRSCDRASMAHGAELRVPLLDHRLVEFAFALPSSHKIKGGVQRAFFRDAIRSLLPADLADTPKRAVVDPQREWLRGPLSSWVEDLIGSRSFAERGLFDVTTVRKTFEQYKRGEMANSFHIWQWVSMELWFRQWSL